MKIKGYEFYKSRNVDQDYTEDDFLYFSKVGNLAFDLGLSDSQVDLLMEVKMELE